MCNDPVGEPVDSELDGFGDGSGDSFESDGDDVSEAHGHASDSLTNTTMFKMWLWKNLQPQLEAKYLVPHHIACHTTNILLGMS